MKLNPYLNFSGDTEEAMRFYAKSFRAKLTDIVRFKDMPMEGVKIAKAEESKVMHVGLPLGDGQMLMASDVLESLGQELRPGNNAYVSVHVDSRKEADRLFAALSKGGKVEMPLADMPWGDYWCSFRDRFGVQWMISHADAK